MSINTILSAYLLGEENTFSEISNSGMTIIQLTNLIKRGNKKGLGKSINTYPSFKLVGLTGAENDSLLLNNCEQWIALSQSFEKRTDKVGHYKTKLCLFIASLCSDASPNKKSHCYTAISKLTQKTPIIEACKIEVNAHATNTNTTILSLIRETTSPKTAPTNNTDVEMLSLHKAAVSSAAFPSVKYNLHENEEKSDDDSKNNFFPKPRSTNNLIIHDEPVSQNQPHVSTPRPLPAAASYPSSYTELTVGKTPIQQAITLFEDYADKAFDYRKYEHWTSARFRFCHWNRHHEMPARELVAQLQQISGNDDQQKIVNAIVLINQKIADMIAANVLKSDPKESSFLRRARFTVELLEKNAKTLVIANQPTITQTVAM
jgi:hypothetical protein